MTTEDPEPSLWSDELRRVLVVAAAWSFAFSTFYLLPKFLELAVHATRGEIGLTMGVFGWATVAVAPLTSRVLDRCSARDAFVLGTLLTAVASLGFALIHDFGPTLLAIRILQAFAHALVFTAVGVAVAELVAPERLSEALGLSGASMLVMNAVAPALLEPVADHAGWSVVFATSAAVAVAAALFSLRLPSVRRDRESVAGSGYAALLRTPLGRDFAIVAALAGLAFGTVFAFEPGLALSLGRESVGGFFVAYAVGAISMRLGLGRIPDRFGRHRVASLMFVLYAIAVTSLAVAPSALLEVVGLAFGIAHGLFYPSINGIVLAAVEPALRGRIFGLFTAAFYLGFAGPSLLGPIAERAGIRGVFVFVGATTTAGAVLLIRSQALRAGAYRPRPLPPQAEAEANLSGAVS